MRGVDDVRGVIIGGDYVVWQLFYEGRSQNQQGYAESEEEAIAHAKTLIASLRSQYGSIGLFQGDAWEVRFYN